MDAMVFYPTGCIIWDSLYVARSLDLAMINRFVGYQVDINGRGQLDGEPRTVALVVV